jgi:tetratricopeptide (TPR) repeat protein
LYLLYTRSKSRLFVGGSFLTLIAGLLPFLGFFAFESQATSTVANRYIYLAMIGPAIWIGYVINSPKTLIVSFVAIITTITFSFLGMSETEHWKNDENLWKHALEINSGSPIAHKILADQYREQGNFEQARKHYKKVLISNTTSPEVQFHLADIQRLLGNQKEAIPLYRKVLELDTNFAAAHNALGLALFADEKFDQALKHFKKAVASNKDDAKYLHNLGKNFAHLNNYQEAIKPLRAALKTKSLDLATEAETQALLGQALEQTNQKEMGQIHLETALKLAPDHAVANKILADVYFSQENFQDALPHYLKSIKTYPDDEKILLNLGIILAKQSSYTKAKGYFSKALEINPESAEVLTQLAITEFQLKKFKDATEHFQQALKISPKTADAYYYLGDIARWKGKKEEALSLYYRALKITKDHSKAHYRLGNYFMKKERVRQAIRHYKSALKNSPTNRHLIANLKRAELALKKQSM